MKKINSIEEFDKLVEENDKFFVFKHSSTCPVSQAAFEEYEKFAEEKNLDCYYLVVQESRPLSNHIAEKFEVRHQSPQALLLIDKGVTWNDSHWRITYDSLKKVSE